MKGHPGYFGDDADFCVELIKKVGSPNFKLLFDIYHGSIINGEIIRKLRRHREFGGHIHTAKKSRPLRSRLASGNQRGRRDEGFAGDRLPRFCYPQVHSHLERHDSSGAPRGNGLRRLRGHGGGVLPDTSGVFTAAKQNKRMACHRCRLLHSAPERTLAKSGASTFPPQRVVPTTWPRSCSRSCIAPAKLAAPAPSATLCVAT